MNRDVYILAGCRTPIGAYGGSLSTLTASQLGAAAVRDALQKASVDPLEVEALVMGHVLSADVGQAPARQVSIFSGLPYSTCATTVNKVCASSMKAIHLLTSEIRLGEHSLAVAGGMESMSQVPHYVPSARFGLGYGHRSLVDGLLKDGLTDVYSEKPMGYSGDTTAARYQISREDQDEYAIESFTRAKGAWVNTYFTREVSPVLIDQKKGDPILVAEDESYKKADFIKMKRLKPVFSPEGTVTAANASPLSDGASAVVLSSDAYAQSHSLKGLFRIVAYAEAEQDPAQFTTSPILATELVLKKAGMTLDQIDYFEVNEAFAVVPLVWMKVLGVSREKVNVYGGAIALGHPLGNSGCRIVVTLMNILDFRGGTYGLATICNGGGGASALIIEKI